MVPGAPSVDAPIAIRGTPGWLLSQIGDDFNGLYFSDGPLSSGVGEAFARLAQAEIPVKVLVVVPNGAGLSETIASWALIEDHEGLVRRRFDASTGTFYLLRPDQHVCARWRRFDVEAVHKAVRRATANGC